MIEKLKNTRKILLSFLLLFTMMVGMIPGNAMAADLNADIKTETDQVNPVLNRIFKDKDFSSERLIVKAKSEDKLLDDNGTVLGNIDDMYLVQYDSEQETVNAYAKYKFKSADAFIDGTVQLASGDDVKGNASETAMTEDDNPFAEIESIETGSVKADIALIDTGVSDKEIKRYSVNGDALSGDNKHGDDMLFYMRAENPDAKVVSIRALNDEGIGSVSDVYAAIKLAEQLNVKYINLSIYANATKDNEIINDLIDEAQEVGITVVGSAGNEGMDASGFIPGKNKAATIVGSSAIDGSRRAFSNYGDTVDYYIPSESTSEATARMTGILSAGRDIDKLIEEGVIYGEVGDVNKELEDAAKDEQDNESLPTNVYRPLSDLDNEAWKELSDEKINEYYWNNNDEELYKFLSGLSKQDLEELISRDTLFVEERQCANENGETFYEQNYKYILRNISKNNTSDFKTAATTYSKTTGYYYVLFQQFNIYGSVTAEIKYKINLSFANTNGNAQQNVTVTASPEGTGTLNPGLSVSNGKTYHPVATKTGSDGSYAYTLGSNWIIVGHPMNFTQPAYTNLGISTINLVGQAFTTSHEDVTGVPSDYRQYGWPIDALRYNYSIPGNPYTLAVTQQTQRNTTFCCNIRNAGISYTTSTTQPANPIPTRKYGFFPIKLNISFNANGGSAKSGYSNPQIESYKYNDTITGTLYDVGTLFTKTGYHTDHATAWKLGSTNISDTAATYTPTSFKAVNTADLTPLWASLAYSVSLTANWQPNQLTINYYANGATSSAGTSGNKTFSSDETNNVKSISSVKYNYNEATNSMDTLGLPNTDNENDYWFLQKPGYRATEYWHVGSPTGPLISANTPFANSQTLATALGVDISSGNKEVNLYADFEPLTSNLYVNYVDEDGDEIFESDVEEKVTDQDYTTKPRIISGYKLVKIPDNITGKMGADETNVNYVYRKTTVAVLPKLEEITEVNRMLDLYDDSEKIEYRIKKTDQSGNNLAGAVFQIKALTDILDKHGDVLFYKDSIITTAVSDTEGNVDFGTYFPTNKYADPVQYAQAGNKMYEITEVSAPEGVEKSDEVIKASGAHSGDDGIKEESYTVKNKVNDHITIQKTWADGTTANRSDIYVDIYKNDGTTLVKSNVLLNESNNWTASVEDVPRLSNGVPVEYTFVEKTTNSGTEQSSPNGYTYIEQSYDGSIGLGTITNAADNTSASVQKIWNDRNNADGIRPDSVEVDLFQINVNDESDERIVDEHYTDQTVNNNSDSGRELGRYWEEISRDEDAGTAVIRVYDQPYVLSGANNWSVSVDNLPLVVTKDDGQKIAVRYEFRERATELINGDARTGYAASTEVTISDDDTKMQTSNITNKHEEMPVKAHVIKEWDDSGMGASTPDSIQVKLLANGEEYSDSNVSNPIELKKSEGWKKTIDNLPRFINGEEAKYTFEEIIPESGYNGTLPDGEEIEWQFADAKTEGNTTKIINSFTKLAPASAITVNKIWNDTLSGEDAAGREKPVFSLKGYDDNNNLIVESSSANDPEEDNWIIINDRVWQYQFTDIPSKCDHFEITEEPYDGYDTRTEETDTNTCEITAGDDATFINTEKQKQNFNVEKVVTGESGEQARSFPFKASITGLEPNKVYDITYTPYLEDGTRYTFTIPEIINDTDTFKLSFDQYEDESVGRIDGADVTSVKQINDIDVSQYDNAFEVNVVGQTTWHRRLSGQKVYTEIDLYHKADTDINTASNWVVDVWNGDELIISKLPLTASDMVKTESLAAIRESGIRHDTVRSDKDGNILNAEFQLKHGEKWTISDIPVDAVAHVDEDIEGLTYTNKWEYYDDDTAVTEFDNETDGDIKITEDAFNPTVRCTNISNIKQDLHLKKIVTGNIGSRDRRFPFRVNLEGLSKSTSYDVIIKYNDGTEETYSVTSTYTGELSIRTKLAHTEEMIICGVPSNTSCVVYEKTGLLEAYTQNWEYKYTDKAGDEYAFDQEEFSEENGIEIDKEAKHGTTTEPEISYKIRNDQENPTLICTNNAETLIPTGIASDHWKAAVIIVLAIGGAVVLLRKKTYKAKQEE